MDYKDVPAGLSALVSACIPPGTWRIPVPTKNLALVRDFTIIRQAAATHDRFLSVINGIPALAVAWCSIPRADRTSLLASAPCNTLASTWAAAQSVDCTFADVFTPPELGDIQAFVHDRAMMPTDTFYPTTEEARAATSVKALTRQYCLTDIGLFVQPNSEKAFAAWSAIPHTAGRLAAHDPSITSVEFPAAPFELGWIMELLLTENFDSINQVASRCPDRIAVKGALVLYGMLQCLRDAANTFLWIRTVSRRVRGAVALPWDTCHIDVLASLRWY